MTTPITLIAGLEPTATQMTAARARFAGLNFTDARAMLSGSTCHVEPLAAALASGDTEVVRELIQLMVAERRAYDERRTVRLAELRASRTADTANAEETAR